MNFAAILALLANKDVLTVVEAIGHGLATFAAHNKEHLGDTASADIAKAGAVIQEGVAVAGELAPQS